MRGGNPSLRISIRPKDNSPNPPSASRTQEAMRSRRSLKPKKGLGALSTIKLKLKPPYKVMQKMRDGSRERVKRSRSGKMRPGHIYSRKGTRERIGNQRLGRLVLHNDVDDMIHEDMCINSVYVIVGSSLEASTTPFRSRTLKGKGRLLYWKQRLKIMNLLSPTSSNR